MFSTNIMRLLRAEVREERMIEVEYTPDYNYCLFDSCSTFSNYMNGVEVQKFHTNKDLEWYLVELLFKPYLVSIGWFDDLKMSASKGAKKQKKLINEYNKTLYSSKELGAKGVAMTVKDYLQMPKWWKQCIGKCHIASDINEEQILCVDNGVISRVSQNIVNLKVPILVQLPEDISVTIDKNSNGEIMRILRKPKHKWKII